MKIKLTEDMLLLDALQRLAPDSSKTTLRSWIKQGRVFVEGIRASRPDLSVCCGQTVSLGVQPKRLPKGLSIIYQDQHLVAIDKPSGLLSVSTAFETEETAYALLKAHFKPQKVEVVHRLDQDTSGVMIFALSLKTRDVLKQIFEMHSLERLYIAVVEGYLEKASGTWESHLIEDPNYYVHSSQDLLVGKPAITHFRRIAGDARYTGLELTLETGRKNQIRVHCQDAGHPVVGDKKYGAKRNPLHRLCLHSHRISLVHPITGKKLVLVSPVPESFRSLIEMDATDA